MKNHWMHFFSGSVNAVISGKGTERFINECVRQGIVVWNVKKPGTHTLSFSMYLKDVKKIRRIVRKNDCKLRFIGKKGLPFLIQKALYNSGFFIGAISFFIIVTLLSNMVWGIKVVGAKPETEHLIIKELKKLGVEKGKLQFFIEDNESLQRHLEDAINDITWIGVELNGTTYHFEVVEKNQPEAPEQLSPRDLVANKKAIIKKLIVEEGKPVKAVNDLVKKGDLLVTGKIGKEGEEIYVPARGKIFGETWYKADVKVDITTKLEVLTGENKTKHYLLVGNLRIPLWGFGKIEYKEYQTESQKKHVKFFNWQLPIAYEKDTLRESEKITRKYTTDQAIEEAKRIGRTNLEQGLDSDAEIIKENVLRQSINNGKVELEIKYNVIENIVTTIPLVQGD
ncbi:sporulation protein YqfD [Bacillus sp. REN16]|uniref:sporulation protein YqfD n=1 Tax=Bacillus sp. REN16 TaxID=2887296 RepID=UPI001E5B4A43|nr:sporulation protein YqfD [Bacillus sp. REN16]MCC3356677.1 sporulation protein YqfD [Bacillus sp. REN16]